MDPAAPPPHLAGRARSGRGAPKSKTKVVTASALLVLSWIGLVLYWAGPTPDFEPLPFEGLGAVVAEQAVQLLGPGGRIIVMDRDTRMFDNPATRAHQRGFHAGIKSAGKSVSFTNIVKIDPLRVATVPPGDFADTLKRAGESDVIVCFLPPVADPVRLAKVGRRHASVVAVCTGNTPAHIGLPNLLSQELIKVAIISKAVPGTVVKGSPRASFEAFFEVVTAHTAESLPGGPP